MPTRLLKQARALSPWSMFALVLAGVFLIETGVMFVLPRVLPEDCAPQLTAVIDSGLLTLILAPLLWFLIVFPLQRLAAQQSSLLTRLMASQEDQFRRLAHDLHDGLGQFLTTLTVGLRTIEETSSLDQIRARASELRRIGADAHEEIRRMARGLRPAVLDDLGLAAALDRYLRELRESHGVETNLVVDCSPEERLPEAVETALYRIVQEATANAVRHGRARRLDVAVRCDGQVAELAVKDDGCGFDPGAVLNRPPQESPFGLLSIRQRAEELGGGAAISSAPDRGTTVHVRVPLRGAKHG